MVAARAGDVLVGAQVAPGEVRVVAIPPDVRRLPPAAVRARLRVGAGYRRVTRPCGWNCVALRADEILAGRATRLLVEVKRGRSHRADGARAAGQDAAVRRTAPWRCSTAG